MPLVSAEGAHFFHKIQSQIARNLSKKISNRLFTAELSPSLCQPPRALFRQKNLKGVRGIYVNSCRVWNFSVK